MKLILILFVLFQLCVGQNFNQGRLKNSVGLCLSLPFGDYALFTTCYTTTVDPNQQFTFSLGSTSVPTFLSYTNRGLISAQSNDPTEHYVLGGTSTYTTSHKWSIMNIANNNVQFYILNDNFPGFCLDSLTPFSTPVLAPCDEASSTQIFTFEIQNPAVIHKPVYNTDSIPWTMGPNYNSFLDSLNSNAGSGKYVGSLTWVVAGYTLKFLNCVLRVIDPSNTIIWESTSVPNYCSPSGVIRMQADGNLCIYPHEQETIGTWCSKTHDKGGRYMVFLPPYSYGREFGIVMLNNERQLIGGIWGPAVTAFPNLILIPGNYLDISNPNKNALTTSGTKFITNGINFLRLDDGFAKFSVGSTVSWTSTSSISTAVSPYTFKIQSDYNVCLKDGNNANRYCTNSISNLSRYVVVPNGGANGWYVRSVTHRNTFSIII